LLSVAQISWRIEFIMVMVAGGANQSAGAGARSWLGTQISGCTGSCRPLFFDVANDADDFEPWIG